jgi:hypothetical protein
MTFSDEHAVAVDSLQVKLTQFCTTKLNSTC